jgi:hypothetical protein
LPLVLRAGFVRGVLAGADVRGWAEDELLLLLDGRLGPAE